jgi:hypothetical protein
MKSKELVDSLKAINNTIFANRDTISEASMYMHECIETLKPKQKTILYTGFYVFLNTLGKVARETQD